MARRMLRLRRNAVSEKASWIFIAGVCGRLQALYVSMLQALGFSNGVLVYTGGLVTWQGSQVTICLKTFVNIVICHGGEAIKVWHTLSGTVVDLRLGGGEIRWKRFTLLTGQRKLSTARGGRTQRSSFILLSSVVCSLWLCWLLCVVLVSFC